MNANGLVNPGAPAGAPLSILDRIAAFARWALRRPKPEARQVPRAESLTALDAATYLRRYAEAYRREYDVFTQRPPVGGGYPKLPVSPYLNSSEILCYLTPDGVVVADHSWQPDYEWYIAGGPAMMVDFPETRTPREVTERLQAEGIFGKEIGIYRIVATGGVPSEMWNGDLGAPIETAQQTLGGTKIVVRRFDLDCKTLLQRLTYGALGFIIDFKIPPQESDYWIPQIVRDLGFLTADRKGRRFYHYMEGSSVGRAAD